MTKSTEIIALRKCEAAERHTTAPGIAYHADYKALQAKGFIAWCGAWRLTESGRIELKRLSCPT